MSDESLDRERGGGESGLLRRLAGGCARAACSQLGLVALVVLYVLLGALLFEYLESGPELQKRSAIQRSREECLRELWAITVGILLDSQSNPIIEDVEENVADCFETNTAAENSTAPQRSCEQETVQEGDKPECASLDPELLDILGVDPSVTNAYGKNIHADLASRLEHVATVGLTKETRKELNERYLIPSNCTKIGAPSMNAEIKAAVTEVVTKRDKGIEMRQKQLAAAISGLSTILSTELESKTKDNSRLKQLMDVCRILCDIQHSESVTRRNFAIYSIKKELKDHLTSSKIDKYLFGETLAETLKAAKAVNKSGWELKTKPPAKPKSSTSTNNNLNWKSPAPARRQLGPQRGREPAPQATTTTPQTRFSRNAPPASSSKTSQPPPKQSRRR